MTKFAQNLPPEPTLLTASEAAEVKGGFLLLAFIAACGGDGSGAGHAGVTADTGGSGGSGSGGSGTGGSGG